MLVRATRTLSTWGLRALLYLALFFVVVVVHVALTGALRSAGWGGGLSLFVSGAAVLALVLLLLNASDWLRRKRAEDRELKRARLKLPVGPCCVIWRPGEGEGAAASSMPWVLVGPMRARFPALPRQLGIEGYAIAEFEVNAQGRAKNIHCVDAWPSDIFFDAAREALAFARFEPRGDEHVRFGQSYRMPFVFRISGATRLAERGQRASMLRPLLHKTMRALNAVLQAGRAGSLMH
jgi:TonB family protein